MGCYKAWASRLGQGTSRDEQALSNGSPALCQDAGLKSFHPTFKMCYERFRWKSKYQLIVIYIDGRYDIIPPRGIMVDDRRHGEK
jgi:hypothetical protein